MDILINFKKYFLNIRIFLSSKSKDIKKHFFYFSDYFPNFFPQKQFQQQLLTHEKKTSMLRKYFDCIRKITSK